MPSVTKKAAEGEGDGPEIDLLTPKATFQGDAITRTLAPPRATWVSLPRGGGLGIQSGPGEVNANATGEGTKKTVIGRREEWETNGHTLQS